MPDLRSPVMILVEASWQDSTGKWQTISARVEDKSVGGACIRVKTPIILGSKIRIQWRYERFSGIVKYCRAEGKEYLIGIQRDKADAAPPELTDPPQPRDMRIDYPAVEAGKDSQASVNGGSAASDLKGPRQLENSPPVRPSPAAPSRVGRERSRKTAPGTKKTRKAEQTLKRHTSEEKPLPRGGSSAEPPRKQKETDAERKPMRSKWLELPGWLSKSDSANEDTADPLSDDGNRMNEIDKESPMPDFSSRVKKHIAQSEPEPEAVAAVQVELLPSEEIFLAAGIVNPPKGYGVQKVVDMLNSEHIRGLPKDMKRVAVLMALDAAGVPLEQVRQDATARQEALDSYESAQKKQAEAEWDRMAEEIVQIKAELERVEAHYMARISRNLDGVSRDKARFSAWATAKRQETLNMSEAVELCLKPVAQDPLAPPVSPVAVAMEPLAQTPAEMPNASDSRAPQGKAAAAAATS